MSYKKAILTISFLAIFGSLFYFNVPTANAVTVEELQAQIAVLLAQITSLQQQLAQLQGGQPPQEVPETWCYEFKKNLRYGDSGDEVKALQKALTKLGFDVSGDTSGNFGEFTASAIVGLQEMYKADILTPIGLKNGTGVFHSRTRAKLNIVLTCAPPTGRPAVGITSPQPGGTLTAGSKSVIQWTSKNFTTGGFQLFYHVDDYKPFWTLINCDEGSISYTATSCTFAVPNKPGNASIFIGGGSEGKWKATDLVDNIKIASTTTPSITVVSPNGGETWERGKTYDITWTSSNVEKILIEIVDDTNNTGYHLAYNVLASAGKYSWTIPSTFSLSDKYKINLISQPGALATDKSDNYFSIVAPGTVSYPTINNVNLGIGERTITITDWRTITWQYGVVPSGASKNVDIHLVIGEGNVYDKIIASNVPPTVSQLSGVYGYSWRIGYLKGDTIAPEGSNYSIRVCPTGVSVLKSDCDSLDYSFALKNPAVDTRKITSAGLSEGTTASLGESRNIKWQIGGTGWATNIADRKVDIWSSEYLGPYLGYAHLLAAGVSPTSTSTEGVYTYTWKVGSFQDNTSFFSSSPSFGITVCPAGTTSNVYCAGDPRTYTLVPSTTPSITVVSPNGGESWTIGETKRVSWSATGVNYVRIYIEDLTIYGSGSTNYIYDGAISASTGYYDWTILKNQLPGATLTFPRNYKIRIDGVNDANLGTNVVTWDRSNNYFSIAAPATTPVATSIKVTPATMNLTVGGSSQQAQYQVLDQYGSPSSTTGMYSYAWSSSNAAVARVDQSGNVTPIGAGTANIIFVGNLTSGQIRSNPSVVTVATTSTQPSISFTSPTSLTIWQAGTSGQVSWQSTGYSDTQTGYLYLYTSGGTMVSNPYQDYIDKGMYIDGWNLYLKGGSFNPTLRKDLVAGYYKFVFKDPYNNKSYESPVFSMTTASGSSSIDIESQLASIADAISKLAEKVRALLGR